SSSAPSFFWLVAAQYIAPWLGRISAHRALLSRRGLLSWAKQKDQSALPFPPVQSDRTLRPPLTRPALQLCLHSHFCLPPASKGLPCLPECSRRELAEGAVRLSV